MGIERVLMDLQGRDQALAASDGTRVLVAHVGDGAKSAGVVLSSRLRSGGVAAVLAPSGRSLKGQLRYASAIRATHAAIIGEDELSKGTVTLRDLALREQREVDAEELAGVLGARG